MVIPSRAATTSPNVAARALLDGGHALVGARRIVVEEHELANARRAGERGARLVRRVPQPTRLDRLPGVLLGQVLRVVDEDVGIARERDEARVDARVVLGVGRVDDGAPLVLDAIGEDGVRVVRRARLRTCASPSARSRRRRAARRIRSATAGRSSRRGSSARSSGAAACRAAACPAAPPATTRRVPGT